jgi:hypothetical protein
LPEFVGLNISWKLDQTVNTLPARFKVPRSEFPRSLFPVLPVITDATLRENGEVASTDVDPMDNNSPHDESTIAT